MASIQEASRLVQTWLHGEHKYQFDKFDDIYGAEILARRFFINDEEIPQKWHRNVLFRGHGATRQADQQVLKVCAASRAVIVYDTFLLGGNRIRASERSFMELKTHLSNLTERTMPDAAWLTTPYQEVYAGLSPRLQYYRAAELAIKAVQESDRINGVMELPAPGQPSGETSRSIC